MYSFFFFFFFQAEDGIRDDLVTGVQTCALPIFRGPLQSAGRGRRFQRRGGSRPYPNVRARSEERRVGKECRYRWWAYREKKKKEEKTRKRESEKVVSECMRDHGGIHVCESYVDA